MTSCLSLAGGRGSAQQCEDLATHVINAYLGAKPAADDVDSNLPDEELQLAMEAACVDQLRERTATVVPLRKR